MATDPASLVFRGVEGTGAAYITEGMGGNPVRQYEQMMERTRRERKEEEEKNKSYLNYKFGDGARHHTSDIIKKTHDFFNFATQKYLQGARADTDADLLSAKDELERKIVASKQLGEEYDKIMSASPKDFDEYTNSSLYKEDIARTFYNTTYDDAEKVKFAQPTDPRYFKKKAFLQNTAKALANTIQSDSSLRNGALGQMITDERNEYKFATTDPKTGKLIPGVDQKHVEFFLQDERYRGVVTSEIEQDLKQKAAQIKQSNPADPRNDEAIMEDLIVESGGLDVLVSNKVKADIEGYQQIKEESKQRTGFRYPTPPREKQEKKVKTTVEFDVIRNMNYSQNPDKPDVRAGNRMIEISYAEDGGNKPILINPVKMIDEESNRAVENVSVKGTTDQTGRIPVRITALTLVPINASTGKIRLLDRDNAHKEYKEGKGDFRWYVQGVYEYTDEQETSNGLDTKTKSVKRQKKVLIPWEDAKKEVQANYGTTPEELDKLMGQYIKENNIVKGSISKKTTSKTAAKQISDPLGILDAPANSAPASAPTKGTTPASSNQKTAKPSTGIKW